MTLWMIWTLIVSGLLAAAASMAERVLTTFRLTRRFVWVAAMLAATIGPAAIALGPVQRPADSPPGFATNIDEPLGMVNGVSHASVAVWQRVSRFASIVGKADEWLLRGWLLGSGTMLVLIIGATLRMRRRSRGWIEAETDFGRVFISHDSGPAVVGSLRPVIVIPRWALALERTKRELMLRHEREHLRAHDSRLLLVAALLITVFPWNAALWWMMRRLRLAIEIDCDARVIRAVGAAHEYGAMLLSVGDRYAARPSLATSMAESGAQLEARITAMMTPAVKKPLGAALPFAFTALGIVAVAGWLPAPAPAQVVRPNASAIVTEPKPLRGNPSPRYPDALRESGVEGQVMMTFATDAGGIPDTSTIEVLLSSHKLFEAEVRNTLPRWRYDSQGHVRFAVRFMGIDTERLEASGTARSPSFMIEGGDVMPVIVVAQLERPAGRRPPGSD